MSATALTPTTYTRNSGAVLTWENADQANGNSCTNSGKEVFIILNLDASTRTVTFTSVADPIYGRTENIAIAVAQYEVARVGPLDGEGWNAADGTVAIGWSAGTTTTTKIRVARLTGAG